MADTEKGNVTSNLTADDTNKVGVTKSAKKLKTVKLNDILVKGGRTMTGSPIDKIEINPVQEQAEHTAVTNLNMRAQPPHKGHAEVIKAVENEAKRVGGSAHIVTSHSEGDEKNPISASKKVGYLKKMASPGTHVSATSREAPSVIDTAARLNRHAHHLVVVAGSDRADEYEKLLHRYNGKPDKTGKVHYNFKSITVKKLDRDPDAEGTSGISGTKLREHAKNGNISGFKSGLPPELHQHAEEMMNDINKASKKKMKEEVDSVFDTTFIDLEDTKSVLEAIDAAHREAVPRSGQDRKKLQYVSRKDQDRKTSSVPYRQQSVEKKILEAKKTRKSGFDRIWNPNTMAGRKMIAASDEAQKAVDAMKAAAQKDKATTTKEDLNALVGANKQIKDINKISVGQSINLPGGGTYTAQKGDSLSKIASNVKSGSDPSKLPSTMANDPAQNKASSTPTPASSSSSSGRDSLMNRSMGAFKAKVMNNISRVSKSLETPSDNRAGSAADRLPTDHTGSSSAGDTMSPQQRSDYEKSMKPYRDLESKSRKTNEAFEQLDEIGNTPQGKDALNKVANRADHKVMSSMGDSGVLGNRNYDPKTLKKYTKVGQQAAKRLNKEESELEEGKRGLWDNIWAKRKRIKAGSGEHMRKPGSKGAPTAKDFKDSQ
ncbi:hypothetical protein UFOVP247_41 [uncultured Caudovirales phage]|uniref:LysM domain-containing protein n=1 Tax=uncultured Caudovirales phage TaxID=2100421 RepID=A0A6J7WS77_9CAUD|nr:hypothetical protein UFOVP247_41 [uncultured Caudovirales phage]